MVVPGNGIDTQYLSAFNLFIREKINSGFKFFIVVGGGTLARHYIEAGKKVIGDLTDWDLDWLGIHSTHLNAHLVRTIFRDVAHSRIIENYEKKITNLKEKLVIAAGWKPGCSTDFDAVTLAKDYGAQIVINMSNIETVFDSDPKVNPKAKPIHNIKWDEFKKLVGDTWRPGINLPFDPIATKLAAQLNLTVYVVGKDLTNLDKILNGLDFLGTIISS